jgi:hypothetical protein
MTHESLLNSEWNTILRRNNTGQLISPPVIPDAPQHALGSQPEGTQ